MSRVKGRKSPITGSIVVADIVLAEDERARAGEIRDEVLARCREHLASYKVPAAVRFIETLDVTSAGKLARVNAQ
jgi:acyl-coenzyme A synthetase/AMP-(fatty) acid ligase